MAATGPAAAGAAAGRRPRPRRPCHRSAAPAPPARSGRARTRSRRRGSGRPATRSGIVRSRSQHAKGAAPVPGDRRSVNSSATFQQVGGCLYARKPREPRCPPARDLLRRPRRRARPRAPRARSRACCPGRARDGRRARPAASTLVIAGERHCRGGCPRPPGSRSWRARPRRLRPQRGPRAAEPWEPPRRGSHCGRGESRSGAAQLAPMRDEQRERDRPRTQPGERPA